MNDDGWVRGLLSGAGLLGLAGVAVGAAGTHAGGGDLARLAALFLLIHAAAVIGVVATAGRFVRWRRAALVGASLLVVGVVLFSGDLALIAFAENRALAWSAPLGGMLLMLGWLTLALAPLLPAKHVRAPAGQRPDPQLASKP